MKVIVDDAMLTENFISDKMIRQATYEQARAFDAMLELAGDLHMKDFRVPDWAKVRPLLHNELG